MTDFLIRGKRKDNGEWLECESLLSFEDEGAETDCPVKYRYMPLKYVTAHATLDKNGNIVRLGNAKFYEVIPETVGRFTGLTDKNGTKIFEGDVVKFCDIKGVINYSIGCYCVKTNKPDWKSRNNPAIDIVLNEYENELKVIGNIHDNPELLGDEEN